METEKIIELKIRNCEPDFYCASKDDGSNLCDNTPTLKQLSVIETWINHKRAGIINKQKDKANKLKVGVGTCGTFILDSTITIPPSETIPKPPKEGITIWIPKLTDRLPKSLWLINSDGEEGRIPIEWSKYMVNKGKISIGKTSPYKAIVLPENADLSLVVKLLNDMHMDITRDDVNAFWGKYRQTIHSMEI